MICVSRSMCATVTNPAVTLNSPGFPVVKDLYLRSSLG